MRASEFINFLDDTIKEITSRQTVRSDDLSETSFTVAAKQIADGGIQCLRPEEQFISTEAIENNPFKKLRVKRDGLRTFLEHSRGKPDTRGERAMAGG